MVYCGEVVGSVCGSGTLCDVEPRGGGCCELKKERGGGKMRGGGLMNNVSIYGGGYGVCYMCLLYLL